MNSWKANVLDNNTIFFLVFWGEKKSLSLFVWKMKLTSNQKLNTLTIKFNNSEKLKTFLKIEINKLFFGHGEEK